MKVKELIEFLQEEDPEKEVVGFPITYPMPEGARITFEVTWVPSKNNLRSWLQIHVPGEPAWHDSVITFI